MPTSPSDLLVLAESLHQQDVEVASRCAVSRAYYAALHAVGDTFDQRPEQYRVAGESTHREIIGRAVAYGNQALPGRTSAATIAKLMPSLRRLRNAADYELDSNFDKGQAAGVLEKSRKILALCEDVARRKGDDGTHSPSPKAVDEAINNGGSPTEDRPPNRPSLRRIK